MSPSNASRVLVLECHRLRELCHYRGQYINVGNTDTGCSAPLIAGYMRLETVHC